MMQPGDSSARRATVPSESVPSRSVPLPWVPDPGPGRSCPSVMCSLAAPWQSATAERQGQTLQKIGLVSEVELLT